MALTASQAETRARALTRHDNDTRFSTTQFLVWLNEEYRKMRSWLRQEHVAPALYLLTSSNQTVAAGGTITLSSISGTLEGVYLVEWDASNGQSEFRPMEKADSVDRQRHKSGRYTFRVEAGVVKFGPDDDFSGTVRVLYHNTPADLTAPDTAVIPVQLEQALILRTCGWIAIRDGDGLAGKKEWDDLADRAIAEQLPSLVAQHGIHPSRGGLHVVMGY